MILDFGYTEGYKKNSKSKSVGDKSHLFAKLVKNFDTDLKEKESNLEINLQNISNRKYLKLYRIDSNLVNYETNTLENFVNVRNLEGGPAKSALKKSIVKYENELHTLNKKIKIIKKSIDNAKSTRLKLGIEFSNNGSL